MLEPKEKGGEVTLQQELGPIIIVDVGEGNAVTIKNTKLLMKSDYVSGKNDAAAEKLANRQ